MVKINKKSTGIIMAIPCIVIAIIIAIVTGINTNMNVSTENDGYKAILQISEEQVPVEVTDQGGINQIESGQGEIKVDGYPIPTVEAVESDGPVTETEENDCPEGEECGRGAYYPTVDVSSPQAFANATLRICENVDNFAGSQCWDSMALFFMNYAGHTLYTCGTGAAKGTIVDGCWQKNAGDDFVMIWDKTQIQAGDIAVYSTGRWGHIGMAMGPYNNGYFALLGQNQGGPACPGGGAAGNIINLSTRDFIGAFRPKAYIKPKPTPAPSPEPAIDQCKVWNVKKGDTLGAIMKACTSKITWGEAMNEYASHWYSTSFKKYLTVYDGWTSKNGVGLFAGDTIEYRAD